jgi:hypothetical protein
LPRFPDSRLRPGADVRRNRNGRQSADVRAFRLSQYLWPYKPCMRMPASSQVTEKPPIARLHLRSPSFIRSSPSTGPALEHDTRPEAHHSCWRSNRVRGPAGRCTADRHALPAWTEVVGRLSNQPAKTKTKISVSRSRRKRVERGKGGGAGRPTARIDMLLLRVVGKRDLPLEDIDDSEIVTRLDCASSRGTRDVGQKPLRPMSLRPLEGVALERMVPSANSTDGQKQTSCSNRQEMFPPHVTMRCMTMPRAQTSALRPS